MFLILWSLIFSWKLSNHLNDSFNSRDLSTNNFIFSFNLVMFSLLNVLFSSSIFFTSFQLLSMLNNVYLNCSDSDRKLLLLVVWATLINSGIVNNILLIEYWAFELFIITSFNKETFSLIFKLSNLSFIDSQLRSKFILDLKSTCLFVNSLIYLLISFFSQR